MPLDRRFDPARPAVLAVLAVGAVVFAVLTVLVESKWRTLERLDADIAQTCHRWVTAEDVRERTTRILSDWVWDPFAFRGAVLVLCVWLWRRGERRQVAWAVVAMVLAVGLSALAKPVFDRPRPEGMAVSAPGGSFPSGHVTTGVVGTGVLLLALLPFLTRTAKVVAYALAAATALGVGATRVILGAHFLSDVVAGAVLGVLVLVGTGAAFAWQARHGGDGDRGG